MESKGFIKEWQEALALQPAAWDWQSFGYGALAGALITAVAGGVVLYFAWPYIKTIPLFKELYSKMEELKKGA